MPAPHPLSSLIRAAETLSESYPALGAAALALVQGTLREHLERHGLDVRAAAAALRPPVEENALHVLIGRARLRPWLDSRRVEKSTGETKKDLAQ